MAVIEAYLDRFSVLPGEAVRMRASTDLPDPCKISIIREGAPEEEVYKVDALDVGCYPTPGVEQQPWINGPNWPVVWEFRVPANWRSGVYRIELSASQTNVRGAYVGRTFVQAKHNLILVVRESKPASRSKILLQLATNTYWAYNNWGGKSVYSYNSFDKKQASHVTLRRPGMGYMSGCSFEGWERHFVQWADRENIPLEFATNYDLHTWPKGFDDYRLILSVGHDEYWSAKMRDHLEGFIAKGGNAAFFSGNSVCWQVRFEDDGQTMVTYKEFYQDDPVFKEKNHALLSTLWSHPLINRPENKLTGVGFSNGGFHKSHGVMMDGKAEFTVHRPDHWVLEGANLKKGDTFGGAQTIVGYECDGCAFTLQDGLPVPTCADGTPSTFTILATAPACWGRHNHSHSVSDEAGVVEDGHAVMGLYTTPAGGTVFTAGTTDWSHGLAKDKTVSQITRNLLTRLGK